MTVRTNREPLIPQPGGIGDSGHTLFSFLSREETSAEPLHNVMAAVRGMALIGVLLCHWGLWSVDATVINYTALGAKADDESDATTWANGRKGGGWAPLAAIPSCAG